MNKQMKIGLGVVAALVLAGAGVYAMMATQQNPVRTSPTPTLSTTPTPSVATTKSLSYEGVEGKSALELLRAKDPDVGIKGEGANAFVTRVNGYTADDSKKEFWGFSVNGKMSDVGAGSYTTKSGDQIEWKLLTY